MIKIKIKTRKLTENESPEKKSPILHGTNDFGVYTQSGEVINYILVDMTALNNLIEKNRVKPEQPVSSKLLTRDALFNAGVVAGGLELEKASEQLSGPCLDGYNVNASVVAAKFSGQKIGKELYKLAMSHVGAPVIPDRSSVSPSAQNVWASLERDGSVKKEFDLQYYGNSDTPKKFKITKLDTGDETPPPGDDCEPTKTKNAPDFLNRAYETNQASADSKQLISKFNEYVKENISEPSAFYSELIDANNRLFATRLTFK